MDAKQQTFACAVPATGVDVPSVLKPALPEPGVPEQEVEMKETVTQYSRKVKIADLDEYVGNAISSGELYRQFAVNRTMEYSLLTFTDEHDLFKRA